MIDFLTRMFFDFLSFARSALGRIFLLVFAPAIAFLAFVIDGVASMQAYFSELIDAATNAAGGATTLTLGTSFGIANSLVPLDLMFTYSSVILPLMLTGLIYRAVKSWIPTVS